MELPTSVASLRTLEPQTDQPGVGPLHDRPVVTRPQHVPAYPTPSSYFHHPTFPCSRVVLQRVKGDLYGPPPSWSLFMPTLAFDRKFGCKRGWCGNLDMDTHRVNGRRGL
eukprot:617636-Hanusia_phi.AAC.3